MFLTVLEFLALDDIVCLSRSGLVLFYFVFHLVLAFGNGVAKMGRVRTSCGSRLASDLSNGAPSNQTKGQIMVILSFISGKNFQGQVARFFYNNFIEI